MGPVIFSARQTPTTYNGTPLTEEERTSHAPISVIFTVYSSASKNSLNTSDS
jgi:hypothetical protein